jgi:sec-independent protein translocase protein TatA
MGLGGISIWQLLIVLAIVIMIFGTKRLGSLGSDLGGAIKGFKKAMGEGESGKDDPKQITAESRSAADAEFPESKAAQRDDHRSGGA